MNSKLVVKNCQPGWDAWLVEGNQCEHLFVRGQNIYYGDELLAQVSSRKVSYAQEGVCFLDFVKIFEKSVELMRHPVEPPPSGREWSDTTTWEKGKIPAVTADCDPPNALLDKELPLNFKSTRPWEAWREAAEKEYRAAIAANA